MIPNIVNALRDEIVDDKVCCEFFTFRGLSSCRWIQAAPSLCWTKAQSPHGRCHTPKAASPLQRTAVDDKGTIEWCINREAVDRDQGSGAQHNCQRSGYQSQVPVAQTLMEMASCSSCACNKIAHDEKNTQTGFWCQLSMLQCRLRPGSWLQCEFHPHAAHT